VSERFYGELATWWPHISPTEDYEEEAGEIARLLGDVGTVLELGAGGGSNAFHLKDRYALTLSDLSAEMLAVSARLNPELEHVQGDMRTLRLERTFDAVLVHDAIDYMTTEADLRQAIETAFAHCRPGGAALFMPDHTAETFAPDSGHGGGDAPDGRGVRFLEWTHDPDPGDDWILTEYAFLLRDADGTVRTVHETHRTGCFATAVWLRLLAACGFDARVVDERTSEERVPRRLFVAARPAADVDAA